MHEIYFAITADRKLDTRRLKVRQTHFACKEFRDDCCPQRHHEENIGDSHLLKNIRINSKILARTFLPGKNWEAGMEPLQWHLGKILLGRWLRPDRRILLKQNASKHEKWVSATLIPATKPTHFAYGVTVRSHRVAISRTIVVVTQMHPQKTQISVICKK